MAICFDFFSLKISYFLSRLAFDLISKLKARSMYQLSSVTNLLGLVCLRFLSSSTIFDYLQLKWATVNHCQSCYGLNAINSKRDLKMIVFFSPFQKISTGQFHTCPSRLVQIPDYPRHSHQPIILYCFFHWNTSFSIFKIKIALWYHQFSLKCTNFGKVDIVILVKLIFFF